MDSLAIRRSLTILEDRYRELREIGQKRFEAWEQEIAELKQQLAAQAEILQQVQQARDEQASKVQSLEGEMAALKGELDAAAKEKAAAQHSAAELKQQLTVQADVLHQAQKARDASATRVQALEVELALLKVQRDRVAAGLQRLRHLAHPAGK